MAENKKSFLLYSDYQELFEALSDENAGKLIKHIMKYVNDESPSTTDEVVNISFIPIKLQLKRDLKKWEGTSANRSETGRLGGIKSGESRRKKKQNEANEANPSKSKQNEHDTVTVTVNDTEREKPNPSLLNFFYIGTELFKYPISSYLKLEHGETLNAWQMQNKGVKIQSVFDEIDKDVGKVFGDRNHPLNFFKSTAKDILRTKNNPKQTQSNKPSLNYGVNG